MPRVYPKWPKKRDESLFNSENIHVSRYFSLLDLSRARLVVLGHDVLFSHAWIGEFRLFLSSVSRIVNDFGKKCVESTRWRPHEAVLKSFYREMDPRSSPLLMFPRLFQTFGIWSWSNGATENHNFRFTHSSLISNYWSKLEFGGRKNFLFLKRTVLVSVKYWQGFQKNYMCVVMVLVDFR